MKNYYWFDIELRNLIPIRTYAPLLQLEHFHNQHQKTAQISVFQTRFHTFLLYQNLPCHISLCFKCTDTLHPSSVSSLSNRPYLLEMLRYKDHNPHDHQCDQSRQIDTVKIPSISLESSISSSVSPLTFEEHNLKSTKVIKFNNNFYLTIIW